MICARLDSELRRLAQRNRCTYTRYADDLTFSTSMASFPPDIAKVVKELSGTHVHVGSQLEFIINDNGFSINYDKVRLQTKGQRQSVTGITVNEKCNLQRSYIRQIRAMLHAWEKHGEVAAENYFHQKYDLKNRSPYKREVCFREVLRGKIEFLGLIRGKGDTYYCKYRKKLRQLAPEMVSGPPCLEASPGLSKELHLRVCELLLVANEFQNDYTLRALFRDPDLAPWHDGLPSTLHSSPRERVDLK